MKIKIILLFAVLAMLSCKPEIHREYLMEPCPEDEKPSIAALKAQLTKDGFQIFDYVDPDSGDTVVMQQYYMAFLKAGPNRSQTQAVADSLQKLHLEHLGRMYANGFADISGPFGDDGEIRGVTIYNVPTLKMADSLANSDPMVKAGRLAIEMHPWWAAKGFGLR
ncbi:YciI family protein [Rasiella sp. SM2506]|uniref:YciI family protein n=1 Tax=Rasiella sp. SM2506 TaxID=3423914 RepID=UPI003D7A7CF8